MNRDIICYDRVFVTSRMPEFVNMGAEGARPFFTSTTITGVQTGVTNMVVGSTTGLAVGQTLSFTTAANGAVTKTILTIPDSTHVTFSGAITSAGGEVVTVVAGGPQYPIFKRVVMPYNGWLYGIGVEMNGLLTGATSIDMNLGCFSAKNDTYKTPDDLISTKLQGILNFTSAGVVGYSSRHWQQLLFQDRVWIAKGTHFFIGGLWRINGAAPTAGGLNGYSQNYYTVGVGSLAAYRGGLRGAVVKAYSASTLLGLPAAIQATAGGSFPTGWNAVTSNGANQDCLADMNLALLFDETN